MQSRKEPYTPEAATGYIRDVIVKSGFMVGLGESEEEIEDLMFRFRDAGCDCVTIGQYLQPTRAQIPVSGYWEPPCFEARSELAKSSGIRYVVSGPLVRSSYHSKEVLEKIRRVIGCTDIR